MLKKILKAIFSFVLVAGVALNIIALVATFAHLTLFQFFRTVGVIATAIVVFALSARLYKRITPKQENTKQ